MRAALALNSGRWKELTDLAIAVSAYTALGGILGLIAATIAKETPWGPTVNHGEWVTCSGALFGLFAITVEASAHLAGLG